MSNVLDQIDATAEIFLSDTSLSPDACLLFHSVVQVPVRSSGNLEIGNSGRGI